MTHPHSTNFRKYHHGLRCHKFKMLVNPELWNDELVRCSALYTLKLWARV